MILRPFQFVAMFLLLIFTFGFSGTEGVVKTVPSPDFPYGLTFDGTHLWVGTSYANSAGDFLWQIDTTDGSVVNTIPVPDPTGFYTVKALAFDGVNLWVFEDLPSASHPDKIYQVDPSNGSILKTLNAPDNNYMGGMAFGNGSLWLSQYYSSNASYNNVIHEIDTSNGSVIQTFPSVGEQPMGVAFDGQFVWCAEDTGYGATRQEIYQYDPSNGTYTGTFIKNPDNSPRDMTWDGQYLWMVGYNSRLLYQISLSGGTPQIQLPVNSLNYGLVSIGDSSTQILNILNNGDAPLIIDSAAFDTSVYFSDNLFLPLEIAAGNSFALEITFAPDSSGPVNGSLTLHSNDPLHPVETVTLSGQGQFVNPAIWVNATFHDFGSVWVSGEGVSSWNLTIVNAGNSDLEIVDLILNEPEFYVGGFGTFPIIITPNDTFELGVFFEPSAVQSFNDTMFIGSNDPFQPWTEVILSGSGVGGPFDVGYQFWNYHVPDNPRAGSFQEYEVDGLRTINDITGDGVNEVVIATENYWILCLNGAGSGMTDTLWSFITYISNSSAGSIGANFEYGVQDAIQVASDLNGDGFNDVVIATGGGNEHVYAIDGTNGVKLWEFGTDDPNNYGLGDFEAVDVRRDFNSDGVPDVLAIADGNQAGTGYKSAYLFNGPDGTPLWQYNYPGPNPSFGKSIISVEDVTGDGQPDAIIAVGNNSSSGLKTYCLDGQTGLPLWDHDAVNHEPKELLELPIPGETPDVIVGEYFSTIQRLDGETGIPVWTVSFGGSSGIIQIDRISDVNNDGIDDVLIASFSAGANCLSGDDGSYIWTFPTEYQFAIAAVPDLTGDSIEEVLFGTGNSSPTFGNFYCISGLGDSVLYNLFFPTDKVYTVQGISSIDGNNTVDLLAGTRAGQVLCFSGGPEIITGVIASNELLPEKYVLKQNYPNPFNPSTTISFDLPEQATVDIQIYDVLGRLIRSFSFNNLPAGTHEVVWDGTNQHNVTVPSGIYIYQARLNQHKISRQMLLLK